MVETKEAQGRGPRVKRLGRRLLRVSTAFRRGTSAEIARLLAEFVGGLRAAVRHISRRVGRLLMRWGQVRLITACLHAAYINSA